MIPKIEKQTKFKVRLSRQSDAIDLFTYLLKRLKNLKFKDSVYCSEETGKALITLSPFHFQKIAPLRQSRYSVRMFNIPILIDNSLELGQFRTVLNQKVEVSEEEEIC